MRAALRTNLPVHRAPPALAMRIGSALPREAPPPVRAAACFDSGFAGAAMAGGFAGVALTLAVTRFDAAARSAGRRCRGRPCAVDDGGPPDGRRHQRPAYGQALAVGASGSVAGGQGFRRRGLSAGRWAPGLRRWPPRRRDRVPSRQARHQSVRLRVGDDRSDAPLRQDSRDGFNIVRWRMDGLSYVAVSDVEAAQLLAFARLVEQWQRLTTPRTASACQKCVQFIRSFGPST